MTNTSIEFQYHNQQAPNPVQPNSIMPALIQLAAYNLDTVFLGAWA